LHRIDKPLPVPDLQPSKRRGGKRYRKAKELSEMSEVRKQQNRLKFGEEAEEEINEGVGMGMLTQGSGKLKLQIKKQKLSTSKKMTQRMNKQTGFESTVNLSAPGGIELVNPDQNARQSSGAQSIFNKSAGFQTVLNNKFGSYK
jgi:U4/U6 small nuclear ribonucleoprotein PRP31